MQTALKRGPYSADCSPSERKHAIPCPQPAAPVMVRYQRVVSLLYLLQVGLQLGLIQAELLHKARLLHDVEGEQG